MINADGTGLRRLTRNAVADGHPAWSPDGGKIALSRWHEGPAWNSRDERRRQRSAEPDADAGPPGRPALVAGRRAIPFSAPAPRLGAADVYVMNANGSGLRPRRRLASRPLLVARRATDRLHPPPSAGAARSGVVINADERKAPDSRPYPGRPRLPVVVAGRAEIAPGRRRNLQVSRGRQRTASSDRPRLCSTLVDGRRILFASGRDGGTDLFVMNADGSGQRNLTSGTSPNRQRTRLPLPAREAARRRRRRRPRVAPGDSTAADLWVMNADGAGNGT